MPAWKLVIKPMHEKVKVATAVSVKHFVLSVAVIVQKVTQAFRAQSATTGDFV